MSQWIAHWTSNPEVAGSNPVKSDCQKFFLCEPIYAMCHIRYEYDAEICINNYIRHGVVGNISACHADARGSIPRVGVNSNVKKFFTHVTLWPSG